MEVGRNKPRILRVLRSVMLAGAGAVVWLALSSTAANADSGSSNHTLLGSTDSAVTNVVHNAVSRLSETLGGATTVPAKAGSAPVVPAPAVIVSEMPQLTRTIDKVVASTPVVNVVVPDGTVGAVTTPVVSPAVGAVNGVGTGVGTLLDGVIAPALGAVGPAVEALPVSLPVTFSGISATIPAIGVLGDSGAGGTPSEQSSVLESVAAGLPPVAVTAAAPLFVLGGLYGLPVLGGAPWNQASWNSGAGGTSASNGTFPDGVPVGGDAGNGATVLASNTSGAATAWLPGMNLFHPFAGVLASTAAADRVPAPVSFDPGSSPD